MIGTIIITIRDHVEICDDQIAYPDMHTRAAINDFVGKRLFSSAAHLA